MVEEWVALCPIFEVCAKDKGYEGGGRLYEKWWQQKAAERQTKTTLKYISAAAWEQRQQESVRRGEGKGVEEESGSGGDG